MINEENDLFDDCELLFLLLDDGVLGLVGDGIGFLIVGRERWVFKIVSYWNKIEYESEYCIVLFKVDFVLIWFLVIEMLCVCFVVIFKWCMFDCDVDICFFFKYVNFVFFFVIVVKFCFSGLFVMGLFC